MKLLYFAWLRQKIGVGEEAVEPPPEIADVRGLVEWLKGRGDGYAQAFRDLDSIKLAVNQEYAGLDHPIKAGDEVAFFPPVTGG
ncbi:MAG: molybdopterin converting factor subunit 1 [Alphaproteobacteria bacterium]|nr:molybdopterin converting factor subunit 1 [Alphaproteobacteria bacterium]